MFRISPTLDGGSTPERVIKALTEAKLVSDPPPDASPPNSGGVASLGDWTFLITEYGRFWVQTILISGAPEAVQVFSAEQGELIVDPVLLKRLAGTDSSLSALDFEYRSARVRVLALFAVGDVYVSLCKKSAYAPFSARRRS